MEYEDANGLRVPPCQFTAPRRHRALGPQWASWEEGEVNNKEPSMYQGKSSRFIRFGLVCSLCGGTLFSDLGVEDHKCEAPRDCGIAIEQQHAPTREPQQPLNTLKLATMTSTTSSTGILKLGG